jgi:hypothetical protein
MANNCWNYVTISGDKNVLDKIQEKFSKYDDFNYFTEFGDSVLNKKMLDDYSNLNHEEWYMYGTKWWDFDVERSDDNTLIYSGDSAWSPPLELMRVITDVYPVSINGEYSESGCDFGGFFSCEDGNLSDETMTYREYQLETDRDWAINDIIDEFAYWDVDIEELDSCDYLTEEEKEYIKEQIKIKL